MKADETPLPGRLARLWEIAEARSIADTVTSHVWRVRRADGPSAVVKSLKPAGLPEEAIGADFLDWRDGVGAVRLLERNGTDYLLEDAGDEPLIAHLDRHGDDAATQIAITAMMRLHTASEKAPPVTLMTLQERFESLFTLTNSLNPAPEIYLQAACMARDLIGSQADTRPLHGDLHHDNIIFGSRGWLVIDAKGLIADPAFDAANLFYNPVERQDLRTDTERHRNMAAALEQATGRLAAIFLRHAFAFGCLSASWHREDGNHAEEERSLAVATSLRPLLSP